MQLVVVRGGAHGDRVYAQSFGVCSPGGRAGLASFAGTLAHALARLLAAVEEVGEEEWTALWPPEEDERDG